MRANRQRAVDAIVEVIAPTVPGVEARRVGSVELAHYVVSNLGKGTESADDVCVPHVHPKRPALAGTSPPLCVGSIEMHAGRAVVRHVSATRDLAVSVKVPLHRA